MKTMKKNYYIFFLLLGLVLAACNKDDDIIPEPTDSTEEETSFAGRYELYSIYSSFFAGKDFNEDGTIGTNLMSEFECIQGYYVFSADGTFSSYIRAQDEFVTALNNDADNIDIVEEVCNATSIVNYTGNYEKINNNLIENYTSSTNSVYPDGNSNGVIIREIYSIDGDSFTLIRRSEKFGAFLFSYQIVEE